MSSTTSNLTNINFMSKERYDNLEEIHDDELYAVKIDGLDGEQIINQNPNGDPIKFWTGTRAEYDLIEEKDPNTVYSITNDGNDLQSLLETMYPVGAIYIGTMEICPMSALFGTWEKVSSGRVLQGADEDHSAGETIEAGLPNITYSNGGLTSDPVFDGPLAQVSRWNVMQNETTSSTRFIANYSFDASRSNSIYGNADTVQPAAFVVNIWKRTA